MSTKPADDLDKKRRKKFNRRSKDCTDRPQAIRLCSDSVPSSRFDSVTASRKYYDRHLPEDAVKEGLEKGFVFRGAFRVNAYNRLEAYCTVDGLPIDILINGLAAQNRAVEGDVVAVMLDPVASWVKLKGSAFHSKNSSIVEEANALQLEEIDGVGEKLSTSSDYPGCIPVAVEDGNEVKKCGGVDEDNPDSSWSEHGSGTSFAIEDEGSAALERWCAIINSFPSKRPTGTVLSIIEQSPRRDAIVGFLSIQQSQSIFEAYEKQLFGKMVKKNQSCNPCSIDDSVILRPNDPKFPDMIVSITELPNNIMERVRQCDLMVERFLVAAQVKHWTEESLLPLAHVIKILGRGGEVETQIAAIFFENKISVSGFSPESLSCLPHIPWKIPTVEFERRKDLRHLCTFTIDPASAIDLDDALSVEKISEDVFQVGVHIADVSYFVCPGSALDDEAKARSTSVYVSQQRLPMLPPLLSEELGSLNPGVDRLAFSVMWDISGSRGIINQWIGRSIIRSCCKLSYEHAQSIIDGTWKLNDNINSGDFIKFRHYSELVPKDVIESVMRLHKISEQLKESRFKDGALRLDSAKLVILFDEYGTPYDGTLSEQTESNSLVEEFMLLANRTVAEVMSKSFRECSLLRRHPEPNMRKLKEFKAFCNKHGFELDTSSSAQLHISLLKIKEKLRDDPILFDILLSYASKPMQLAVYFCTGDLKEREDEWRHYALAAPVYTHFTSPLRRYPDIVVHQTLCAVLEAEELFLQAQKLFICEESVDRCFTSINFNMKAVESQEGKEALSAAALKYNLPGTEALSEIAAHCNNRKLASKNAEESGKKVYLWAMLRNKENMVSEARVMGLGPKFMSVYIHKLAIERRIYYTDVLGLTVEWLENTTTLVLDLFESKRAQKKGFTEDLYPLEFVALVINPSVLGTGTINDEQAHALSEVVSSGLLATTRNSDILPAAFPLTLRPLSTIPVVLHAVGGDDGPVDVGVRLYMSSYFH